VLLVRDSFVSATLISANKNIATVAKTGYYLPWAILAGALVTLGCGLMSTFSPTTSSTTWAGFQVLLGAGRGMGMSLVSSHYPSHLPTSSHLAFPCPYPILPIPPLPPLTPTNQNPKPILALQNCLDTSDSPVGTAFMFFGHTMGGAIFLTSAQSIFTNGLRTLLPVYAPAVDPAGIINAGATHETLAAVDYASLEGVIEAVCKSTNRVFYMTTIAGFAAFCFAWGMGWVDIRKRESEKAEAARSRSEDPEKGGCCLALRGLIFREA